MDKKNHSEDCRTCQGHGFRVEILHGVTVNADTALTWRIKGKQITCPDCVETLEAPASLKSGAKV